jgi:predicted MFS family arabinose efflux permease
VNLAVGFLALGVTAATPARADFAVVEFGSGLLPGLDRIRSAGRSLSVVPSIMASIAVAGLCFGIPRVIDAGLSAPSIRDRLAVVRQVPLLIGFLVTMLWATGAYTVYTYLTPYLTTVTQIDGAHVGIVFFVWGVWAVIGLFLGGTLSDRFGPRAVMIPTFTFLTLSFVGLSMIGFYLSGKSALVPVAAAIVVWGRSAPE